MFGDNVGSIEYDARINTSKLKGDAAQTEAIVQNTGDNVEKTGEKSFGAFAGWAKVGLLAAGAATVALGVSAFKTGVEYNTLQQTSRAALKTILGSTEAAGEQMNKLNEFVKTSPFSKDIFIKAQQTLLGFGVAADKVIPTLSAIQDSVAAIGGSSDDIGAITQILAKIKSEGRLGGEALLQLGGYGIDAATIIGSQMGKSGQEIRDMASQPGGIPADQVFDPLVNGLSTKFGGAADNVKNTWAGTADRIGAAFRDLGSQIAAPFVNPDGGGAAINWGNKFADFLRNIPTLVAPFLKILKEIYTWFSINILPILKDVVNFMNTQLKQAWIDITTALKPFISEADLIKAILFATLVPLGLLVGAILVFVSAIAIVIAAVARLIGWIIQASAWFTQLQNNVAGAMGSFINSVSSGINSAISWFSKLPGMIMNALSNIGTTLHNAGKSAIDGFIQGIKDSFGSVKKTLGDLTSKLPSWKGPESTDKKILNKSGQYVITGFIEGLESMYGSVHSSLSGLTTDIATPAISGSSLSSIDAASATSRNSSNINVSVSMAGIMSRSKSDERDIAKSLIKTVNEELSAKGVALIGGGNI